MIIGCDELWTVEALAGRIIGSDDEPDEPDVAGVPAVAPIEGLDTRADVNVLEDPVATVDETTLGPVELMREIPLIEAVDDEILFKEMLETEALIVEAADSEMPVVEMLLIGRLMVALRLLVEDDPPPGGFMTSLYL